MIDFKKLFPGGSKKADIKIRTKRAMVLTVDGNSQHVPDGSEVTINADEFAALDAEDYQMISSGSARRPVVEDPTPAKPEPAPVPAAWASLPPCFAEYHKTQADITATRQHIELIRDKQRELFGTANVDFDGGTGTILAGTMTAEPRQNIMSSVRPINLDDPTVQRLARFLTHARVSAEDYLARLIEKRNLPQQRLYLECGQHRIEVAEELQGIIEELAKIGFTIFKLRLSALGLHENHVRRLFNGSADFMKFASHQPAHLGDLRFGGMLEDGTMRIYSDTPVHASAGHLLRERERIAELRPLLKIARAELAKAEKATLPTGLPA